MGLNPTTGETSRRLRSSRGGVLVEAAVALPLFFGLLLLAAVASKILSQRLIVWDGIRIAERNVATRPEDESLSCSARALGAFTDYVAPYGVGFAPTTFCVVPRVGIEQDFHVALRLTNGLCGMSWMGGTLCEIVAERTVTLEGDFACPPSSEEDLCPGS